MTPEQRAHAWVEEAYLCEHGERNEFRHNYECEVCVANLLLGAALRERDATWTKALHGLDVCGHSMFRYQGDDPTPIYSPASNICQWCRPLRALLEEAGK